MRSARDEGRLGSDRARVGAGQESLLGSDRTRPGAGDESLLAQARLAQEAARRRAQETRAASVGKVASRNEDGSYEVTAPDGSTISGCQSRKRASWLTGQWVLLEWVQGQPQIAGFAPHGAG